MAKTWRVRGFYGVVDVLGGDGAEERARGLAMALLAGGAGIVQVRMKRGTDRELLAVASAVRGLTAAAGVPLVINDRLDIALAVNADGVHLGQEDLPVAAARAALAAAGRSLAIGVSTHDEEQVRAAVSAGVDYLGFGPVYPTSTKERPAPVQGIKALAGAVRAAAPLPVVAIGGITPERAAEVAAAGAAAACAIAAVNGAVDPVSAARLVTRAFGS